MQVLQSNPGGYLAQRKQLVAQALQLVASLGMSQETGHTAVALMDRVMMTGVHMTPQFHMLFVCACLRMAAMQEGAFVPATVTVAMLVQAPGKRDYLP